MLFNNIDSYLIKLKQFEYLYNKSKEWEKQPL